MLAGGADLELGCQEEGRGADATPDLQSSKFSCLRQNRPEATVTGLLKPERSPRVLARRQDQGGIWRPLTPVPLTPIKAQNRYSCRVADSEATRKGSSTAGRGHAIRIPLTRSDAPVSPTRRRPATARCWTDPGRQCDSAEDGAWPLRGGPLRRQSHTAPGRPTYAKLGPGRAAAGGYTRVEPFGGPWLPYGRTRLWRPGWQRASSRSGKGSRARARARGTITGSGVSG